jgi:hypothetical protein
MMKLESENHSGGLTVEEEKQDKGSNVTSDHGENVLEPHPVLPGR